MKALAAVSLTIMVAAHLCCAQEAGEFKDEAGKYKKKKISGIIFLSATGVFGGVGTILMIANRDHTYSYSGDGRAGFGFTSAGGGVGLMMTLPVPVTLIVGAVKLSRGIKYGKYYENIQ